MASFSRRMALSRSTGTATSIQGAYLATTRARWTGYAVRESCGRCLWLLETATQALLSHLPVFPLQDRYLASDLGADEVPDVRNRKKVRALIALPERELVSAAWISLAFFVDTLLRAIEIGLLAVGCRRPTSEAGRERRYVTRHQNAHADHGLRRMAENRSASERFC
jgi:hypothetical protein